MGLGDDFARAVTDGPLLLALPVAAAAGLVSFLSPCCLPLMPGYLSYVTGLAGSELSAPATDEGGGSVAAPPRTTHRARMLAGSALFVLGFSIVFVSEGLLFGGLGDLLVEHRVAIERVLGVVTILLGMAFLDLIPVLNRDVRVRRLPDTGLAGAPLLGIVFGLGWTPCLGPTLAAVQGLALDQGSAGRGAILSAAYCLGLGIPFIAMAVAFERALRAFAVVKRHYGVVKAIGGGLLVVVGVLLVTGLWEQFTIHLRVLISGYTAAV
ncbi:MAG: cytochrome c-type biosis protein [Thermoleophilaceae bacterium]|nr:cytochrome c-type biosis protein [Thermoleophilaceae bacterium]